MRNFDRNLVGAYSDKGPVRKANEDAYWVSDATTPTDLGALFIVTDGVGGQVHGAAAAHQAVQVMSQSFYELRREGADVPAALKDSIHQANMAIYEQAQARGGGKMGCTLVAAVQFEGRLHVAHVGDARAYLLQGNRLRRLTRDDTWVQKQVEAGIISAADAEKHELRNVVTQALGNRPEIDIHISQPQDLNADNIVLLCTDGVHGVLNNELLYLTLRNNSPQEAASKLVEAAIAADTQDNVTAVVVNSGGAANAETFIESAAEPVKASPNLRLMVLISLAAAIVILAIFGLIRLVTSDRLTVDLGGGGTEGDTVIQETEQPVATSPNPTQSAPVLLPVLTSTPTPTVQIAPTLLLTDTPPPLPASSPTPALMGCVVGQGSVFVWLDDQVFSNTCNHVSQVEPLRAGMQVRIIDAIGRSVAGPDPSCNINQLIKVQSIDNPEFEGWVLKSSIQTIGPEESCSP